MPLQNRIDPFGAIHAVPERGSLMGNRGIIHDPHTRTLLKKRWALKAWIICVCDFRGVRRVPMGSNRVVDGERRAGWTELFFLDEVTALAAGHDVLLEIDWQGARQVRAKVPDAVSVFILPPSRAALEERMRRRGQDSEEVIQRRLAAAREEMSHYAEFDYVIVNEVFDTAVAEMCSIFTASRLRREAQATRHAALLAALLETP